MAADNSSAVERTGSEPALEPYVSPIVDFVVISFFVALVALTVGAVILP